jgi:hypothetical protein
VDEGRRASHPSADADTLSPLSWGEGIRLRIYRSSQFCTF